MSGSNQPVLLDNYVKVQYVKTISNYLHNVFLNQVVVMNKITVRLGY